MSFVSLIPSKEKKNKQTNKNKKEQKTKKKKQMKTKLMFFPKSCNIALK